MSIPKPDYFLGIGGNTHGAMTGQMIEKIEAILIEESPDWVVVYGDTNSTLAGSIAASKLNIKIAHIEAGLRSFNRAMPEEVNRILTDRMSDLLFCPTQTAIENLKAEGVNSWGDVVACLSGDVMQDGAVFYRKFASKPADIDLGEQYILVTIHRAENTDSKKRLIEIVEALNELSLRTAIILPIHPRTRDKLEGLSIQLSTNIQLIEPVGYLNMVWLIDNCVLVMTDSGGLQKEAYYFQKPCITLRDETEWTELVEHKFNVLVGANKKQIINAYHNYSFATDFSVNLYGNGNASHKIIEKLISYGK